MAWLLTDIPQSLSQHDHEEADAFVLLHPSTVDGTAFLDMPGIDTDILLQREQRYPELLKETYSPGKSNSFPLNEFIVDLLQRALLRSSNSTFLLIVTWVVNLLEDPKKHTVQLLLRQTDIFLDSLTGLGLYDHTLPWDACKSHAHAQAHKQVSLRVQFIARAKSVFSRKEKFFIEGFSIEHN